MSADWATPERLHRNRLPMSTLRRAPELPLDGTWSFQLLPAPTAPLSHDWQDMPVPSLWTRQGTWDLPHYTNWQMPFPGSPPQPPTDNPTGVYRRTVEVPEHWHDRRVVLHVGAAESVLLVTVDGHDVGMSKDAHLAAEFDVTAHLTPGLHELMLTVVKWSDSSYIEDQDQWWHGGISRSVYAYTTGPDRLTDVRATTSWDGLAHLIVDVDHVGDGQVSATLDGRPVPTGRRIEVPGAGPWSPARPELHELRVVLEQGGVVVDETSQRIGFCTTRVDGVDLLLNGERLVLRGVNRHDFDEQTGRVVTPAQLREDVLVLKRFGFNAVRTAHYPNDPVLLDLCDELGLFVIDEANIEAHGYYDVICHDPRYRDAFVDRVSRMVQRDRNHPCVLAWSLGNESGIGANHLAAAAWVRANEPSRPLHYEGAMSAGWSTPHEASDLTCPMYPPVEAIVEHARSGKQIRPLVLCEFSHAMGNSNGSLAHYVEAFETVPGLQGGFIWEMRDHGLVQELADGTTRWAYGGDFGDTPHDGTFVCDGLLWPDRRPKPAMWEHLQLAAPLRLDGDRLVVAPFTEPIDDLMVRVSLDTDAGREPVSEGSVDERLPVVVPPADREAWLTVELVQRQATAWAEPGWVVGTHQRQLREAPGLSADLGTPAPLGPEGVLLPHGSSPRLQLWRAPTDNDRLDPACRGWEELGLRSLTRTEVTQTANEHESVLTTTWTTAGGVAVHHVQCASLLPGGELLVTDEIDVPLDDLPRVGLVWTTPLDRLTWWGRGPHETYPDRCAAGSIGRWHLPVTGSYTPYIRPQESGGRSGVRWLELADNDGAGVRVAFDQPRQVSAIPYSAAQLEAAGHHEELVPGLTHVSMDLGHRGVGTASCGPGVQPQHQLRRGVYRWRWTATAL